MKLYRFRYSGFARKVQMLLDLLQHRYDLIEVPYGDRSELARLTGGYILVPVFVADDGGVTVESRRICQQLLVGEAARRLTPAPLEGPIWAYADFCDGPLEDVLFRIASPAVRDAWAEPFERALYTLVKERKFGQGCVEHWLATRDSLYARARDLLRPTLATLEQTPFLFGSTATLADAALYGNLAMLSEGDPELITQLSPTLRGYMARVEAAARQAAS